MCFSLRPTKYSKERSAVLKPSQIFAPFNELQHTHRVGHRARVDLIGALCGHPKVGRRQRRGLSGPGSRSAAGLLGRRDSRGRGRQRGGSGGELCRLLSWHL